MKPKRSDAHVPAAVFMFNNPICVPIATLFFVIAGRMPRVPRKTSAPHFILISRHLHDKGYDGTGDHASIFLSTNKDLVVSF